MPTNGFHEEQTIYAVFDPLTLIGQFRRLGGSGPAYEIKAVSAAGLVEIELVYSDERLTEKLADVLADPIAETLP